MILGVILCCVICVQIEARIIKPISIMRQEREIIVKRFREQNDAYGTETIQLNNRSPRAPSWPEANSSKKKMFLLPRTLEVGDQINITFLISRDPHQFSISLITEKESPNGGTEPDFINIASQLYITFGSDDRNGLVSLRTIIDGAVAEHRTDDIPSDLFPDVNSTNSEVTIRVVVGSKGFYEVEYYIGPTYIDKNAINHTVSDIRYIGLDGDVEKVTKLDFTFA